MNWDDEGINWNMIGKSEEMMKIHTGKLRLQIFQGF